MSLGNHCFQCAMGSLSQNLPPCCLCRSSSLPCGPTSVLCCGWRLRMLQAGKHCKTLHRCVARFSLAGRGGVVGWWWWFCTSSLHNHRAWAGFDGRLAAAGDKLEHNGRGKSRLARLLVARGPALCALALPSRLPHLATLLVPVPGIPPLQYLRSKSRAGVVTLPATQQAPPARPVQRTLYLVPSSQEICSQLGAPWEACTDSMLALVVPLAPR